MCTICVVVDGTPQIFGGKDVSKEIPELGQCALYCVTEVHTDEDIDKLVYNLKEIVS